MSARLPSPPGHPCARCSAPPGSGRRRTVVPGPGDTASRLVAVPGIAHRGMPYVRRARKKCRQGFACTRCVLGGAGRPAPAGRGRPASSSCSACHVSGCLVTAVHAAREEGTGSRRGMAAARRGRDVRAGMRRAGGPPETFPENDLLVVQVPQGMKRAAQGAPHRRAGLDPAQVLAGRHHDHLDMRVACSSGHVSLIARRRGTAVCR